MREKIPTCAAYRQAKIDLDNQKRAQMQATNAAIVQGARIGAPLPKKSAKDDVGGSGGSEGEPLAFASCTHAYARGSATKPRSPF